MKLLYLAKSRIPSRAANSVHVMKMCACFAASGHKVTLLVPQFADQGEHKDSVFDIYGVPKNFVIKRITVPKHKGGYLRYAWRVLRYVRVEKFDLIYGRDIYPLATLAFTGISVGYEMHSPAYGQDGKKWIFQKFFRHPNLRVIVAISESLQQILIGQGLPKEKIRVAHDGADEQPPPSRSTEAMQLRIGYVGNLYEGKGMEMIAQVTRLMPEHHFVVAGGLDEDINKWKRRLADVNNVEFLGFVRPSETAALRQSCDVLLAPFQNKVGIWGGSKNIVKYMSPLKVFEYMSSGRAMIVSDLPVLREVLSEDNSVLVSPESAVEWSAAIRLLQNNIHLRNSLGHKAYHDFMAQHTWQQRANKILAFLFSTNE